MFARRGEREVRGFDTYGVLVDKGYIARAPWYNSGGAESVHGKGEWGDMGHMHLVPARHLTMPRLDVLVMPRLSQGPILAILLR